MNLATASFAAIFCLLAHASDARTVIPVFDVTGLDAAVNDSANQGALVVLAPGRYVLDPNGRRAGRLELQQDMSLAGPPGDAQQAIIDASALPASSYAAPPLTTGAIRTGRGSNAVEWLTVQGARNGASAITTDLAAPGPTHVRIAHVVARDNARGLDIRNIGAAHAGRELSVDLADNALIENTTGAGQGLRILNSAAPGAAIRATLVGNEVYANIAGCLCSNSNTSDASIVIRSLADRFDGNANGCIFIAGQGNAPARADHNVVRVEVYTSTFRDNAGPLPPSFPIPGGILAVGAVSTGAGALASGNDLQILLRGVRLSGNSDVDINAIGALSTTSVPAGIDNTVSIARLGVSAGAVVAQTPSVPAEPAGTNIVVVTP